MIYGIILVRSGYDMPRNLGIILVLSWLDPGEICRGFLAGLDTWFYLGVILVLYRGRIVPDNPFRAR